MENIVGFVFSKTTDTAYSVKWNSADRTSWLQIDGTWKIICTYVGTAQDALDCSQRYIDSQPDLF